MTLVQAWYYGATCNISGNLAQEWFVHMLQSSDMKVKHIDSVDVLTEGQMPVKGDTSLFYSCWVLRDTVRHLDCFRLNADVSHSTVVGAAPDFEGYKDRSLCSNQECMKGRAPVKLNCQYTHFCQPSHTFWWLCKGTQWGHAEQDTISVQVIFQHWKLQLPDTFEVY